MQTQFPHVIRGTYVHLDLADKRLNFEWNFGILTNVNMRIRK
jgi:hypothetical protein